MVFRWFSSLYCKLFPHSDTMTIFEKLKDQLSSHNQEHLVQFWDELTDEERRQLQEDISEFDLKEVQEIFRKAIAGLKEANEKLDDRLQPIPENMYMSVKRTNPILLKEYENEGFRQVAQSHVGVLLMAGGQGTRLGFPHPKGMYDVGLPSCKTLFQIQAERIRKLERLAHDATGQEGHIIWYIMTSEHTMEPTRKFFEKHDFFGLREEDIVMFEQGSLPCFDFDGRIILDERHCLAKAPDGNGGIYRALSERGILRDMQSRGVLYLHAHSVDNILIRVADPIFVGYCVQQRAECAAKVVEKSQPNEPVGVVCIVDGKYQVVEYSEITSKSAEMRKPDGRLTFSAGNICNHFFTTAFLQRVATEHEKKLKLHVAEKKIPYVDADGVRRVPEKPNGIKVEKFVFDVFQFAEKFVVVEVERNEEFSALKNSDVAKKDCPSTARQDIFRLHRQFIETAGGSVDGDICEVSPLLSYAGEGLNQFVQGKTFRSPVHLQSSMETLNGHL
ncbi:UDP-N-acetylhexosamine pyrophosphorylase [Lutzomyia longipalpis]|uniref:UDP-N-acetylhexosamine pyrophosphorylase n=1 Tax=Lutzomyia longipalpis TaxID=7200 RepID=UPI0024843597|nr:UDP-N-acetylhexosamine pyrophosphorylase [Lutzomyia longipalpis]